MPQKTLPDSLANTLRRQILRGEMLPGQPIKERDKAAELGVSRTPIREAIHILGKEGLVQLRPARSPVVADPSKSDLLDAITVLKSLELLSGQLATRNATEKDLARLHQFHDFIVAGGYDADPVIRFEKDMEFHMSIAQASGNQSLCETHRSYLQRLWRARFLSASKGQDLEKVFREHGKIIQALENRDEQTVLSTISDHIDRLYANVAAHYDKLALKK